MKSDSLVVWWLTQEERTDLPVILLPNWLRRQLDSSKGRPGRGRLWVSSRFHQEVAIPEESWVGALAKHCEHCAGLVIPLSNIPRLHGLPGIVTTLDLRRLDEVLLTEGVEEDD